MLAPYVQIHSKRHFACLAKNNDVFVFLIIAERIASVLQFALPENQLNKFLL